MKKLYRIQCAFYAVLDDDEDPEAAAHLVVLDLEPETTDIEVEVATELDAGWANSIPFGEAEDHTCAWWLALQTASGE